jgi:hypothetical protein
MSAEIDSLFDYFEEEYFSIFCILSDGNISTFTILLILQNEIETPRIVPFLKNIWKQKIIGDRLWYIYKNECNESIHELLKKDLTRFDDKYFCEKSIVI